MLRPSVYVRVLIRPDWPNYPLLESPAWHFLLRPVPDGFREGKLASFR